MKIKIEMHAELVQAQDEGTLAPDVHAMFLQAGEDLQATTKDVEGSNNIINEEAKRAGHIKIATISDRLKIRRRVLQGENAASKWSRIKELVHKTRNIILEYLNKGDELLGDAHRFSTPKPTPCCKDARWIQPTSNTEKVFPISFAFCLDGSRERRRLPACLFSFRRGC